MQLYQACLRKNYYRTEEKALEVAGRVKAERGISVRTYYCFFCQWWHLTKDKKMGVTVQELAEKLSVEKDVAYGLVRFLEKRGHVTRVGSRKPEGGKGKGTSLYRFSRTTTEGLAADLASFVTDETADNDNNTDTE